MQAHEVDTAGSGGARIRAFSAQEGKSMEMKPLSPVMLQPFF